MATRHMTAGRIKPFVDRTGREASACQFIREAYQNAVEARATNIRIRWEQGASRHNIYRFEIADDGESMSSEELPAFLNKFGGGGKPIGEAHENFGVGLKSSTLPWNHAGIIVVARRDRETNLILLHLDEEADEYGLRQWEMSTDSTSDIELVDVLPIAKKLGGEWKPVIDRDYEPVVGTRIRDLLNAFINNDNGTVVILCGNTASEDTYLSQGGGGQMGSGPHTGIATYLSRRYYELPIHASVEEPKSGDKSKWPTSPDEYSISHINVAGNRDYKIKTRNCRSLGAFLQEGGERGKKKPEAFGVVKLSDGTQASWYLLRENEKYDGKGVGGLYWNPTICTRYGREVYYPSGSKRQRFRSFGISRNAVIDRCTIVLQPPLNNGGAGVYPDSSRSRLLWTGGKNLPWSKWAREFAAKMPPEIEVALEKATASLSGFVDSDELTDSQKKRLNALTRRIKTSWLRRAKKRDSPDRVRVIRVVEVLSPRDNGTNEGGGGGDSHKENRVGVGSGKRYMEDDDGDAIPVYEVKKSDRIPECKWFDKSDFDDPHLIARWNEIEFLVEANLGCPIIRDSIDYWTNEYPMVDQDNVARAVHKVYGLKLRTVVAHMLTAKRRGFITADSLDQALAPIALTTASAGFIIEDFALHGDIGALAGKVKAKQRQVIESVVA